MANKQQVIELADGSRTAREIAEILGCFPEYVVATARRNGLALKRACKPRRPRLCPHCGKPWTSRPQADREE